MSQAQGTERHREIARIESTHLGFEDHGILTAFLQVTYGGAGQGIGGYAITPVAGPYIERTLQACGVDRWERLVGRTVYVVTDKPSGRVLGIEPLPTETGKPFMFDEVCR